MKIPKLKNYYYALNETDYQEFERTRVLDPCRPATIDPATGIVVNATPLLYFYARPATADTRFRQLNNYQHYPVYVLRVPREYIRRDRLTAVDDAAGMWFYSDSILLPHCGVERFELDPGLVDPPPTVRASSRPRMISLDIR